MTLYVFGTIHLPIGFLFLILGSLTAFYARGWVWALGLAVVIASIVDDFAAFALAPLPFDGVIGTTVVLFTALGAVYFLARADVRSFFGGPEGNATIRSGVSHRSSFSIR